MNAMDDETMEIIEKLGNQLNTEENKSLLTKLIEKFNNWSFPFNHFIDKLEWYLINVNKGVF